MLLHIDHNVLAILHLKKKCLLVLSSSLHSSHNVSPNPTPLLTKFTFEGILWRSTLQLKINTFSGDFMPQFPPSLYFPTYNMQSWQKISTLIVTPYSFFPNRGFREYYLLIPALIPLLSHPPKQICPPLWYFSVPRSLTLTNPFPLLV